ncbi:MAG TPA: NDP-sugar synthase [Vicinamibacterales bacterium]
MTAWPPSALVLAAGVGARLHPLTLARAKPAVPIAGVPLVGRILRDLAAAGVRDVVLNLHHRPETIARVVGEGREFGVRVRYTWEPVILGSAGGPRRALPLLASDPYLLINGDTLLTVDVRALWEAHLAHRARVTMTLIPNPAPERYGGVLLDEGGWVIGFTRRGDPRPSYHFFSAQVVDHSVFAHLPEGVPAESVLGVYPEMLRDEPRTIRGFVCDAPFIEVGTPADYLRVQEEVAAAEGTSPWTRGARTSLAESGVVKDSVLWDDVEIGAGAQVERCILTDGVRIPAGLHVRDAAIVRAPGIAPRAGERTLDDLLIVPLNR